MTSDKWRAKKPQMMMLIAVALATVIVVVCALATVKAVAIAVSWVIIMGGSMAAGWAVVEMIWELVNWGLKNREKKREEEMGRRRRRWEGIVGE